MSHLHSSVSTTLKERDLAVFWESNMVKMFQDHYNNTRIIEDSLCPAYYASPHSKLSYLDTLMALSVTQYLLHLTLMLCIWWTVKLLMYLLSTHRSRRGVLSMDTCAADGVVAVLPTATVAKASVQEMNTTKNDDEVDEDSEIPSNFLLSLTRHTPVLAPGGPRAAPRDHEREAMIRRLQTELCKTTEELRAERQKNQGFRKFLEDKHEGKVFVAGLKVAAVLCIPILVLIGLWNAPKREMTVGEVAAWIGTYHKAMWWLQDHGWTTQWVIAQATFFIYSFREDFKLALYNIPKYGRKFYSCYETDYLVEAFITGGRARSSN